MNPFPLSEFASDWLQILVIVILAVLAPTFRNYSRVLTMELAGKFNSQTQTRWSCYYQNILRIFFMRSPLIQWGRLIFVLIPHREGVPWLIWQIRSCTKAMHSWRRKSWDYIPAPCCSSGIWECRSLIVAFSQCLCYSDVREVQRIHFVIWSARRNMQVY